MLIVQLLAITLHSNCWIAVCQPIQWHTLIMHWMYVCLFLYRVGNSHILQVINIIRSLSVQTNRKGLVTKILNNLFTTGIKHYLDKGLRNYLGVRLSHLFLWNWLFISYYIYISTSLHLFFVLCFPLDHNKPLPSHDG